MGVVSKTRVRHHALRQAARALGWFALAVSMVVVSGCSSGDGETERVHSADVPAEVYRVVQGAIVTAGYEVKTKNLRMVYGDNTSTVVVSGSFVAPGPEGDDKYGTLTMQWRPDIGRGGTWTVLNRE